MSKKRKLILAAAVFSAALFGASCGGGDNGGTTAGTGGGSGGSGGGGGGGGGGGNQPPPPTEEGRVLAMLNVGGAGAGPLNPVTICKLMSNNKAECGNDLNPTANVDLEYLYEFPNGNVVLKGTGDVLYFFNGSQVVRPDKYRALGGISDTSAPTGITLPSSPTYYATSNFLIVIDNSGGTKELRVITSSGKVINDSGSSNYTADTSCKAVTKGTTTYELNTDGTSSSTTIPTFRAEAGGKYLVSVPNGANLDIYLSDSRCGLANAVQIESAFSNFADAKMAESGGKYYIAIRHGTGGRDLNYYRVSGDTATTLNTITLHTSPTIYFYALDGRGVLYARTDTNTVTAYKPTDGSSIGAGTVTGVSALLPFADRVLARGTGGVFDVYASDTAVTATSKGDTSSALYTALDRCTDETNTRAIDGVRTNFIRCVYQSGGTRVLYSLTYDSGNYGNASYNLTAAFNNVLWAPNKALVSVGSPATILLCNTTTTPTISCSATDLPDLSTSINNYLKVNGLDVFYINSSGALKVGNVFDPPSALPIAVAGASGGNASFDLNKFAFSFRPAGAPCATQIAYLSSRTASPKTYTIAQPSGACVNRILKVFSTP